MGDIIISLILSSLVRNIYIVIWMAGQKMFDPQNHCIPVCNPLSINVYSVLYKTKSDQQQCMY